MVFFKILITFLFFNLLSCSSYNKKSHLKEARAPASKQEQSCIHLVNKIIADDGALRPYLEALENSGEVRKHADEISDSLKQFTVSSRREVASEVKYLRNPKIAFLTKIKLIRESQTSVDLSYFIFSKDDAGYLLLEELRQAVLRGVQVRILFDSLGSMRGGPFHEEFKTLSRTVGGFIRDENGHSTGIRASAEVVIFNPLFNMKAHIKNAYIAASNFFNFVFGKNQKEFIDFNIDRRSHDKIFLIDANDYENAYAIIGGRNIGQKEFYLKSSEENQDVEVLIKNPRKINSNEGPSSSTTMGHIQAYYNRMFLYKANKKMKEALIGLSSRSYKNELSKFKKSHQAIIEKGENINGMLKKLEEKGVFSSGFEDENVGLLHEIQNISRKSILTDPLGRSNPLETINRSSIVDRLFKDMKNAKETIEIVSPYLHFTNEEIRFFHNWLREDKNRKIKIISNSILSSNNIIPQAHFDFYLAPQLLKGFENSQQLQIYSFGKKKLGEDGKVIMPPLLHAKYFILDGKLAYLGTSNLDMRSRYFNSEVALRIIKKNGGELVHLKNDIDDLIEKSIRFGGEEWEESRREPHSRLKVSLEKLAYYLMRTLVYPLPYFSL